MPEATLDAFRGHGVVRPRALLDGIDEATATLAGLPRHGIEGLAAFEADLGGLLRTLEGTRRASTGTRTRRPARAVPSGPCRTPQAAPISHQEVS